MNAPKRARIASSNASSNSSRSTVSAESAGKSGSDCSRARAIGRRLSVPLSPTDAARLRSQVPHRPIPDRAITSLSVSPHSQAKFRTSRFRKRSCGSRLVSRMGLPQAGQSGALMGGGPDDCGGTCVLGIAVGSKRAGADRHPIAAVPSRPATKLFKHQVHSLKRCECPKFHNRLSLIRPVPSIHRSLLTL